MPECQVAENNSGHLYHDFINAFVEGGDPFVDLSEGTYVTYYDSPPIYNEYQYNGSGGVISKQCLYDGGGEVCKLWGYGCDKADLKLISTSVKIDVSISGEKYIVEASEVLKDDASTFAFGLFSEELKYKYSMLNADGKVLIELVGMPNGNLGYEGDPDKMTVQEKQYVSMFLGALAAVTGEPVTLKIPSDPMEISLKCYKYYK